MVDRRDKMAEVKEQTHLQVIDKVLHEIAEDAQQRRSDNSNSRPYHAMNLIRQYKLGALQLPIAQGGKGYDIRQLFQFIVRLAEADSDVAHILRAHYGYVGQLLRENMDGQHNGLLARIAAGMIIGNAMTEISSHQVGGLVFNTKLTADEQDYRLNGVKYFSTGTLYADLVVVTASDVEENPVAVIIPTNRSGITIEDDWDGIGQQLTGSGTTKFHDVIVSKNEVLKKLEGKTPFNAFPQLYLQAIVVGILKNIVNDSVALIQSRKRTFSFAAAELPKQDPQLLQIIGELSSVSFAAQSMLLAAADTLNQANEAVQNGTIPYELSHQASLVTAQSKVIIDELALRAATKLFDVGGASATRKSAFLDRHWRNIRTLVSHNPAVYKARAIGDYEVNNKQLPIKEVYF